MLLKSSEIELATELCAEPASEKMEVCEDDADDAIEGSYGPVLCKAVGMDPSMIWPTVGRVMLRVY